MPKDRDDELNRHGGPAPEFTLEEILAEYRDRRESGLDDDTIPLPVIPQKDLPPGHRSGMRKGTGSNVVRFPGRKGRPAPPPEEEPEAEGEAVPEDGDPAGNPAPEDTPADGDAGPGAEPPAG